MRTTLNIDDDVLKAARSLARSAERPLGQVISDLARRGLEPRAEIRERTSGFPVFRVAGGGSPITLETVQDALHDDE